MAEHLRFAESAFSRDYTFRQPSFHDALVVEMFDFHLPKRDACILVIGDGLYSTIGRAVAQLRPGSTVYSIDPVAYCSALCDTQSSNFHIVAECAESWLERQHLSDPIQIVAPRSHANLELVIQALPTSDIFVIAELCLCGNEAQTLSKQTLHAKSWSGLTFTEPRCLSTTLFIASSLPLSVDIAMTTERMDPDDFQVFYNCGCNSFIWQELGAIPNKCAFLISAKAEIRKWYNIPVQWQPSTALLNRLLELYRCSQLTFDLDVIFKRADLGLESQSYWNWWKRVLAKIGMCVLRNIGNPKYASLQHAQSSMVKVVVLPSSRFQEFRFCAFARLLRFGIWLLRPAAIPVSAACVSGVSQV